MSSLRPPDSVVEQNLCQERCERWLFLKVPFTEAEAALRFSEAGEVLLLRERHVEYCMKAFDGLPGTYVSLDVSRTWLVYWTVHSLALLEAELPATLQQRVVDFLARCQGPEGGYGGGPSQLPHCAPTYSAILTLLNLGTPAALASIDRRRTYAFFMRMKHASGGFTMHDDGEVDVRGTYTVMAIANLLNILTPQLVEGVAEYILSCQTYEGGFGGEPGTEAHGGYAFCAVSALYILGQLHRCDLGALKHWLVQRQMVVEGGFQGRTNKLVDGCYSFWQGATFAVLAKLMKELASEVSMALSAGKPSDPWFFDREALQKYVLLCCQEARGGLIDKPGKSRDFYHTCYCLSGLSVAQHTADGAVARVLGDPSNLLPAVAPEYNIVLEQVTACRAYFTALPNDHDSLAALEAPSDPAVVPTTHCSVIDAASGTMTL